MAKTLIVLSVDPEFRDLCPPLDEEEKRLLREAIIEEKGARDPIVYWETDGNPILDGHHRHAICGETGLPYPTKGLTFPDRETAIRWIWRHQLGKRNLTDANKHILRGRYYNSLKADRADNLNNGKKPANSRSIKNDTSGKHGENGRPHNAAAVVVGRAGELGLNRFHGWAFLGWAGAGWHRRSSTYQTPAAVKSSAGFSILFSGSISIPASSATRTSSAGE